ncbi:hypothetical protein D3C85_861770 [compost metagenome]
MLQSDRQADQAVGDPGDDARFGRHGGMGHGGWVGDQAFDPAQRLGQGEDVQTLDQVAHGVGPAVQFEAEHGARSRLLTRRQIMAGVGFQTRIVDSLDRRMLFQGGGDQSGGGLLALDAGEQGAQAPQGLIGVERRSRDAQAVGPPGEFRMIRRVRRDHGAADHVGVAVDVFGGRVDDDVGAQLQRALQGGRQEGVVAHHLGPDGVGAATDIGHVHDPQQGVGRGLDQHQLGAVGQGRVEGLAVVLIDEGDAEMTLLGAGRQQAVGAAIAVVRRDQQLAGVEQAQRQVDRGHAGGGDDGAGAAFQLGQGLGQDVAGRVARARVVVFPLLVEAGEGIVGRQIQRRHDRAVGRVRIDARAGGDGAGIGGTGGAAHWSMSFSTEVRISATRPSSFRKASWP